MEWKGFLVCFLVLELASQNVAMSRSLPEQEFAEQKNYYPPSTGGSPSRRLDSLVFPVIGLQRITHAFRLLQTPEAPTALRRHRMVRRALPAAAAAAITTRLRAVLEEAVVRPSTPRLPRRRLTRITLPSSPAHASEFYHFSWWSRGYSMNGMIWCRYWGSHPEVITAVVGSWGSIGDLFGHSCAAIFGSNPSLPAALTNTRQDGYGALFREGTASFLNSMTNSKFPYSTPQVKSAFAGAIASDGMAQAQADIFKQANEGKIKVLS
ncbi:hypothetical protein ZIOFF_059897 [Zingiber officinale]|uniref:Uncharacterized protein n=1 Tax=Zingiber officinale TaxID=94328 RepID=A0A8J5KBR3_ZINOF|nr:hypothetical protein ZIOFF_059897 [Zingiber officinale]